ncbi:MAG: ArsC family reductase [Myxococcales bacterium]|nr:ArsC family reductase [Myxococcales bacterium]
MTLKTEQEQMSLMVYGIPNCDTVKRARTWLTEHGLTYTFVDFKKSGVPLDRLDVWCKELGWEALLNRQGQTWRKLDDSVKQRITDEASARELMTAQPSVIKRPVIEWPGKTKERITVGFTPDSSSFRAHSHASTSR